jgi:hypothetical protein
MTGITFAQFRQQVRRPAERNYIPFFLFDLRASPISLDGQTYPYIEPECPDEEPLPVLRECDPLDPFADCPMGEGCYPYLEYPYGEGCGQPAFGSLCTTASTGEQGDFCGDGGNYCSPGYLCVVGATGGKRCGQICEPVANHGCPSGLVCGETDVQGYGVCF